MHVQLYTQARSRNHCCHANLKNTTYFECVLVALVIHHAKRVKVGTLYILTLIIK